ncbi:hypothetical protein WICPIJ_008214 [Wickerhamomyces pijperi]|uniref:Altered inheritance of mitochondria protein 11 n=1 Tax=Wickerhamomyces pijperi TaxID=599730 RepID=A0A9P8Q0I5_WICPI|nr:hypothetical protein WICPIJ_008214 [Wickerhamomyces pijperi]
MSSLQQEPAVEIPKALVDYNKQYKERRRNQMIFFFGTTAITLLASRVAYRGVQTRKYIPQLFQANHIPPAFSFQRDAVLAVTHASVLATSSFAMLISGICWSWDVYSIKEFGYKLKVLLGGEKNEQMLSDMPLDEESASVQDAITKFLNGEDLIGEEEEAVLAEATV